MSLSPTKTMERALAKRTAFISPRGLANDLGVTEMVVRDYIRKGKLPRPAHLNRDRNRGRAVLVWPVSELEAWMAERRYQPPRRIPTHLRTTKAGTDSPDLPPLASALP